MSDKDKEFKILPGGNTPSEIAESLRKMKESLPVVVEYIVLSVELTRKKFDELKKQGFTDGQALELCKQLF
jgi:hypothetical protein